MIKTKTIHGIKVNFQKDTGKKKYIARFIENGKQKTIKFGDKKYE